MELYEDAASGMTVKGEPTVIIPIPEATAELKVEGGKLLTPHDLDQVRGEKEKEEATEQVAAEEEDTEEGQIGTIPNSANSNILAVHAKGKDVGGGGTHRFTLVDKDAVPLINGKKVSACE